MNNDEIMVSVSCTVYNQEKYLRKCLDGLVNQKTNFKYEILVHDDASTDDSADIIREYEKKYPDIIKPIYQKENQYSKGVGISKKYQYSRVKGKYYALCEGDDYWCDEYKLQKQVDILEKYPNCVICTHNTMRITEKGDPVGPFCRAKLHSQIFPQDSFADCIVKRMVHTTSFMLRTEVCSFMFDEVPDFMRSAPVGDTYLLWFMATKGDMYYIEDIMSCYRLNSNGSWSQRVSSNKEFHNKTLQKHIVAFNKFKEFSNHRFDKQIDKEILSAELELTFSNEYFKSIFSKKYFKHYVKLSLKKKLLYLKFALKNKRQ